jgi:hypothetical protein
VTLHKRRQYLERAVANMHARLTVEQ